MLERRAADGKVILHPHCVKLSGGETFDLNAWARNGTLGLADLRGGKGLARLDSVGGTMLLIRADRHRDGLVFPPFFYGGSNRLGRAPPPPPGSHNPENWTQRVGGESEGMGHAGCGPPRPPNLPTLLNPRRP